MYYVHVLCKLPQLIRPNSTLSMFNPIKNVYLNVCCIYIEELKISYGSLRRRVIVSIY